MIRLMICTYFLLGFTLSAQTQTQPKPVMGKTTGALPYLEYGLGSDRLGGAKMTYLDTGVVMRVVDSTIGNYVVQLSRSHQGYLPKNNFRRDVNVRTPSYYLTSSILIAGDNKYDSVTINLDEKLPYRSIQEINPSRIIVDIFGATSNTNWINHRQTSNEVKNAYHQQIEDDVFRLIIELNHEQHWGYDIYYQGKKMVIKIKQQPKDLSLEKLKIAIDAGHGGDNSGASGIKTGILEKNYTILFARELQKILVDKGANVFMTRTNDASLGMLEREKMIKAVEPDLMLSLHLNSSANDSIRGVSTYYRYIGFRPLTHHILQQLSKIDGLINFGNIGSFNFSLSGPTEYPNCLVEIAFLSNEEDEKLIIKPSFHKQVAEGIVEGIKEWLKECKKQ